MQLHQIHDVEQRVRSYWYEDGLAELATGGVFVLLGLFFAVQGYFGEESIVTVILQVSLALLIILGAYFVRRIVNSLKARWTYPRTGYVEYHVDTRGLRLRRWATAAAAAPVAILLVVLYRYVHGIEIVVLATGVLVGFILLALGAKVRGMTRFYLLSALAFALGIGLSVSGVVQVFGLALFYGVVGVAMMASGGWALHNYLSANPLPAEAPNGR